MDHRRARRSRSTAGRRQASRSWPDDTGAHAALGPGSGPQHAMASGSGPQHAMASGSGPQQLLDPDNGPQQLLDPGSGAQPVLGARSGPRRTPGRTPVRGFPPAPPVPAVSTGLSGPTGPSRASGSSGSEAPEPLQDAPSPWPSAGASFAGEDGGCATGAGYVDDDGDRELVAPASNRPATRRAGARAARTRRRFSRVVLLATAAVLVLTVGGLAGYKYLYEPRVNAPVPSSLRLPTTAPRSPDFDRSLGEWQHIGNRAEDPEPLTLQQLYPPQFVLDGSSYVRTAASVTKDCSLAVFGSQLQAALQTGHCTQALRASYISGNGELMGTVGVVNLNTSAAAQRAGQVTGPQEIIAPLSSKKGATSKLGSGTGVVQAEIKGHYLILTWAEFTSLKSPSTSAQKRLLEQFAVDLVTGSANINLSTRMLTGKA